MDVGIALPQFDYAGGEDAPPWALTADAAKRADALGFKSVWLADHLYLSTEKYGGPSGKHRAIDPIVALSAIARATQQVRIGTLVFCTQLRPPAVLAKSLATLDIVSGGRLTIGMGAGWYEPEYDDAGVAFERPGVRLEQLAEAVEIVKGMHGGGPFTYEGTHYQALQARCLPVPVQTPRPPVWVGGKGDRLLDVVARHADGWNTVWSWTQDAYNERLDVLRRACADAGRDPSTVTLSLGLNTLIGENEADLRARYQRLQAESPRGVVDGVPLEEWRKGRLVGTPEQVGEQLKGWEALGIDTLVMGFGALPFAVTDPADLELAASAVP